MPINEDGLPISRRQSSEDRRRDLHRALERRADSFKTIGNCPLVQRGGPTQPGITVEVSNPLYPRRGDIVGPERLLAQGHTLRPLQTAYLAETPRWFIGDRTNCARPTLVKKVVLTDQDDVNVDHVYELKIIRYFLKSLLDRGLTCDTFSRIFLRVEASVSNPRCQTTVLQTLLNVLPSRDHLEFAGVAKAINSVKGELFMEKRVMSRPKFLQMNIFKMPYNTTTNRWDGYDNKVFALHDIGLTFHFMNDPEVAAQFSKTNTRMYRALLGIDKDIASLGIQTGMRPLAEEYKAWMQPYVEGRASEGRASMDNVIASLKKDIAKLKGLEQKEHKTWADSYEKAIEDFEAEFPGPLIIQWTYDYNGSPLALRDLSASGGSDSCPLRLSSTLPLATPSWMSWTWTPPSMTSPVVLSTPATSTPAMSTPATSTPAASSTPLPASTSVVSFGMVGPGSVVSETSSPFPTNSPGCGFL